MSKEAERWKSEYRDLLQEHEQFAATASAQHKDLRELLRLAVAGCRGWQAEIDEEIEVLLVHVDRTESQTDLDTLKSSMDRVANMIRDQRRKIESTSSIVTNHVDAALQVTLKAVNSIDSLRDPVTAVLAKPEQSSADKLAAIAGILIEALRKLAHERDEAERFLEQVQDSIHHFEMWTADAATSASAQREASSALERQVSDDVSAFANTIDNTSDSSELKQRMLDKLAQVGKRITEFRAQEDRRLKESEARNASLNAELESLREQTQTLKQTLQEQQSLLLLDALTGVNSRFSYDRRLEEMLADYERQHRSFCYTLWDIDHFKGINDTLGHQGGDEILKQVANYLDRYTRKSDFVARIGGEEFVVLLPDISQAAAIQLADKLRALIAAAQFEFEQTTHTISISCGITETAPSDTAESLYKRADEALYAAKRAGRNRCIAA